MQISDETGGESKLAALYPEDVPQAPPAEKSIPVEPAGLGHVAEVLYPDDKQEAEEPFVPHGAPSAYDLTMPEGLVMDRRIFAEVDPVLRELNLSNAGANKLMPLVGKFHARIIDGQVQEFGKAKAEWAKASKADPDVGQGNWAETERLMKVAMTAAGSDKALIELFAKSGVGNRLEMVRAFRNIGRALEAMR